MDFVIDALPVFNKMHLSIEGHHDFKVMEGFSAETSGGILTMLPPDRADDFIRESREVYGQTVWRVGQVVKGSRKAMIRNDCEVISIRESFLQD